MSNAELFLIVSGLSTLIHYAALWGSRFEASWTLEEQLSTAYKRHKARDRKRQEIDAQISEELQKIPRPKWHDILPFALCKAVYSFIVLLPALFGFVKEQVSNQIKEKYENVIGVGDEKAEKERLKLKKQERKKRILEQKQNVPSPYNTEILDTFLSLQDLPSEQLGETEKAEHGTTKSSEWRESDIIDLVHAVGRFPGGIPGRWERIATQLNRTVSDVTAKAKELGETKLNKFYLTTQVACEIPVFETNENAICGESDEDEDEREHHTAPDSKEPTAPSSGPMDDSEKHTEIASVSIDEPYVSRKKWKQQKLASTREAQEQQKGQSNELWDGWTQAEQKQLEVAIKSIDKTIPDRWDRIAECVPTKTKAEVMQRVKHLSSIVKSKTNRP
ncbi:DnaJ subfamily C member 1 [Paragonimus skrjabini miyazakii]|uniref:DnaJ subfamily C member 1 n=1 Tax=Paragonimus skrjabini miyazakii TaxID=59628 RepID=A0A8S9YWM6_9TREM|nr:DnaJ subfamily C member 1 [Paragonimus skrjabini miyazakii]